MIIDMFQNGSGIRDTARVLKISTSTVNMYDGMLFRH